MNTRHYYLRLLRTFALATLTAAAVAACSDDTDTDREPLTPPDGNDGIPVAFTANINPGSDAAPAGAPGTRTILTPTTEGGFTVTWKGQDSPDGEYDQIHIWAAKGTTVIPDRGTFKIYNPTISAVSSALEPATEQNKLTLPSTGTWKFRAIYGSNAFTLDTGEPMVNLYNLRQFKPDYTDHIAYKDFSVATAEEDIAAENDEMPLDISLKFGHKLSALQLRVTNATDAELTIEEIRLAVVGEQMADYRVFDVTAGDWKAGSETKRDNLTLKIKNPAALAPNATPQNFHMLLFPGYAGKQMTITVVTNSGEYTLKKTAPASPGFEAGTNYMTDITINSSNLDPNKETWTEYVNISTADDLAAFSSQVNDGTDNYAGKTVRLLNNITLTGTWTPIGTLAKPFSGTFDGGGYSISGLSVDNGSEDYAGLFGYVKDGTVRNLRVKGTVTTTGDYVGGIAGSLYGTTVENCIFSGEVNGGAYVGGIAGATSKSSSITGQIAGCHTKGKVTATSNVAGGIVGTHNDITMTDCYSEATVTAMRYMAGGIAGSCSNANAITRCYATGAISSGGHTGGIVGYNYHTTVTNCIALNPGITKTSGNYTTFGRIVGKDEGGTVDNCGAFVGMTLPDGVTATSAADGIHGTDLTREQCVTKTTYTDCGFKTDNNSWGFYNGTWTYLPWNKAFESFYILDMADYHIAVPAHLSGGGTN